MYREIKFVFIYCILAALLNTLFIIKPVTANDNSTSSLVLKPSNLFSDNMILQREKNIPIWGTGSAGCIVKILFANQHKETKIQSNGTWNIILSPLKSSYTPQELTISSEQETIKIKNVLVGDVWLCSGQSNMEHPLGWKVYPDTVEGQKKQKGIKFLDLPWLRVFRVNVPKRLSPYYPADNVNGHWSLCQPGNDDIFYFSAVAFFFAKRIHEKIDVPIGIIQSAVGGTPIESWIGEGELLSLEYGKKYVEGWERGQKQYYTNLPKYEKEYNKEYSKWVQKEQEAESKNSSIPRKPIMKQAPITSGQYPCILYNSMIYPLSPVALRGFIWYQGESNAFGPHKAPAYYDLLPLLISSWRNTWKDTKLPFYYVQLANWKPVAKNPLDSWWAVIRDAQLKTLSIPNTGMTVNFDIGDEENIHFHNKGDVGRRLADNILANIYKTINIGSGPLFEKVNFKNGKAILTFSCVGSGLVASKRKDAWTPADIFSNKPERFQICGDDHKWVWADANIISKDMIEVSSSQVKTPIAVRYAWMDNPGKVFLLYNKEGYPASPFRTDSFSLEQQIKK